MKGLSSREWTNARELVESGSLRHLALTADGNGRWAEDHGLPRVEGHLASRASFKEVVETLANLSLPYFSIHVFSPQNWDRSPSEVEFIVELVASTIHDMEPVFQRCGVRFLWSGRVAGVPSELVQVFRRLESSTIENSGMKLQFCFNYGGREEIVDSVDEMRKHGEESDFRIGYHKEVPDVDLYIRAGGELRISNFLLWQMAYAELLFLEKAWPDLRAMDILEAIDEFGRRNRTFGHT